MTEVPAVSRDGAPAWSPDGQQLLLVRSSPEPYEVGVGVVGVVGGDVELVTQAQFVWQAAWSPGSGWIAVADGGDLFRLRPDGSSRTGLVGGATYGAAPDWQAR